MEEINFSALAPRRGTRPLLNSWSDIGTSQMNGGALNWGNIWSGLKNIGRQLKTYGTKAWNSSSGQALRNKLKETKVQDKIIDTINTGIHGAIDIGAQQLENAIQKRLQKRPTETDSRTTESTAPSEPPTTREVPLERESTRSKSSAPPRGNKRGRQDEEDPPPSYEELFGSKTPPPPAYKSLPSRVSRPSNLGRQPAWQGTLNSIVGLGLHCNKKRRCY